MTGRGTMFYGTSLENVPSIDREGLRNVYLSGDERAAAQNAVKLSGNGVILKVDVNGYPLQEGPWGGAVLQGAIPAARVDVIRRVTGSPLSFEVRKDKLVRVAFVCSFNRGRSVIGEHVFRDATRDLFVSVVSAGTRAGSGAYPDPRVLALLTQARLTNTPQTPRAVDTYDLMSDLFVCFEDSHVKALVKRGVPEHKIHLLPIPNPTTPSQINDAFRIISDAIPDLRKAIDR